MFASGTHCPSFRESTISGWFEHLFSLLHRAKSGLCIKARVRVEGSRRLSALAVALS
jgi:hypothetical protein